MGNQARVDILLALRTTLAGNQEALGYLDKLGTQSQKTAAKMEDEFSALSKKLAKKFSASDIGMDILKGFGVGSGFALAEMAVGKLADHFKEAAEAAKAMEESTAAQLDITKKIIALHQTEDQQFATLKKERDRVGRDLESAKMAGTIELKAGRAGRTTIRRPLSNDEQKKVNELTTAYYDLGLAIEEEEKKRKDKVLGEAETLRISDQTRRIAAQTEGVKNAEDAFSAMVEKQKKANEETARLREESSKLADKYKELADPALKFTTQIAEVSALAADGKITASAAAAAIARLKAEMGGDFTKAVNASNEALRTFDERLALLGENPFLTDTEKQSRRLVIMREENAELAKTIAYWKKFQADNPGVDPGGVNSQIQSLQSKQTKNNAELGKTDLSTAGVGPNLLANITQQMNGLRTPAQNIADTISTTIGGAFASVEQNLAGLIKGTEDWGTALSNIGGSIMDAVIEGIVKMFVTWAEQKIIQAIFGETLAAAAVAAMVPIAAAASAIWAAPATLATIATIGGAAAAAPIEISAATMATKMTSMAGFSEGGHTGIGGIVHENEWVAPSWMVDHPGYSGVIGSLEAARVGKTVAPLTSASSSFAGHAKETRVAILDYRDRQGIAQFKSDPRYRNIIQEWRDDEPA